MTYEMIYDCMSQTYCYDACVTPFIGIIVFGVRFGTWILFDCMAQTYCYVACVAPFVGIICKRGPFRDAFAVGVSKYACSLWVLGWSCVENRINGGWQVGRVFVTPSFFVDQRCDSSPRELCNGSQRQWCSVSCCSAQSVGCAGQLCESVSRTSYLAIYETY